MFFIVQKFTNVFLVNKLLISSPQIRGFLSRFDNVLPASLAFDKCTACSPIVSGTVCFSTLVIICFQSFVTTQDFMNLRYRESGFLIRLSCYYVTAMFWNTNCRLSRNRGDSQLCCFHIVKSMKLCWNVVPWGILKRHTAKLVKPYGNNQATVAHWCQKLLYIPTTSECVCLWTGCGRVQIF